MVPERAASRSRGQRIGPLIFDDGGQSKAPRYAGRVDSLKYCSW